MNRPLLYPLARLVARLAAGTYFGRLEVRGRERVPARGPVILAANHPQSITDALVLGVAADRVVHYVAHSGLFRRRTLRWLLRGGGVIPIHRPGDVADAAERNEQSFRACREALERGECLGIFPEGTSQQERRVQRFKTGTVRIALEAEIRHDFTLGVVIVPVGLSFQSHRHFRSRVLVTFGDPISLAPWREAFVRAPEQTVRDVTAVLQDRIRHRVVHVQRQELDAFVEEVERVYKGELLAREGLKVPGRSRFERDLEFSREIARAADYFYETRPELLWSISELLRDYRRQLDRLRLPDRILREEPSGFRREATKLALLFALGLPLAAWGAAFNWLPYKLTGVVAFGTTRDETKIHVAQMAYGTLFFVSFYLLWFLLGRSVLSTWELVIFLLSLPPTGLFARWYGLALEGRRKHLRWAYLRSTRGLLAQRLLNFRQEIIDAMDEALEEYLAHAPGADAVARPSPGSPDEGR